MPDGTAALNRLVAAVLLVAVAGGLCAVAVVPIEVIGYVSNDDAYYYFEVARNIVAGKGVTFDGVNPTNGFHPLWMAVLVPAYMLGGAQPGLSLRLAYAILIVLAGASIWLCWSLVRRLTSPGAGVAAILCFLHPAFFNQLFNGLESGLLMFLLLLLLWLDVRRSLTNPAGPQGRRLVFGLLLGLIFLCRLDAALMILCVAAMVFVQYRFQPWVPGDVRRLVRAYGPVVIVFVLVAAPYFIWNKVANGHLAPISGALKSSFPVPAGSWRRALSMQWLPYSAFVATSATVLIVLLARRRARTSAAAPDDPRTGNQWMLLKALFIGAICHFAYSIMFSVWGVFFWHFAAYVPLMAISVALAVKTLGTVTSRPQTVAAVSVALVVAVSVASHALVALERGSVHARWHDAAAWVRQNTPLDARFAMTDCGYFCYFSRRSTVNLDGLINGYEYQHALAKGTLQEYFQRCGIDYLVDYEVPEDGRVEHRIHMPARLYGKPGFDLVLPIAAAAYRSQPYQQRKISERGKAPIRFMIWRYDPGQLHPRPPRRPAELTEAS